MTLVDKYYNDEQTLDQAYDIFLELASDNLHTVNIELFNQYFTQKGSIELYSPENNWQEYIDIIPNDTHFAEVLIGLKENNQFHPLFARILLSKIKDEPDCYIIWNDI